MTTPISKTTTLAPGLVAEVPYPFVRSTYQEIDEDEGGVTFNERPTWKPGTRFEDVGHGDVECYADAIGRMVLTVVDVHKPGRFPTRVFYTRQWIDPDGKRFGKTGKLHIATVDAFRRRAGGYWHEFTMATVEAR